MPMGVSPKIRRPPSREPALERWGHLGDLLKNEETCPKLDRPPP